MHALHKRPTSGLELIDLQPQFVDLVRQPSLFRVRQETGRGWVCSGEQPGLGQSISLAISRFVLPLKISIPDLKYLWHIIKETVHAGNDE